MDWIAPSATALLVLFGGVALVKLAARRRRHRARRRLGVAGAVREALACPVTLTLFRTPAMLGMRPGGAHRLDGDLLLGADRLVLATGRGVLLDVGRGAGGALTSARCTGPRRLVLEGRVPRSDGGHGRFRVDVMVDDAEGWGEVLAPFAHPEDGETFGSFRAPTPGPDATSGVPQGHGR